MSESIGECTNSHRKNWRNWIVCGLLGGCCVWAVMQMPAWSGSPDETTAIGTITVNPGANNRRAVILQGRTKAVSEYRGQDSFGYSLCGQGFTLEDDTGSIEVLYLVRCHATEVPVLVEEGERVIVYATIDATPTNIKNAEGKELVFKAMATKIARPKQ